MLSRILITKIRKTIDWIKITKQKNDLQVKKIKNTIDDITVSSFVPISYTCLLYLFFCIYIRVCIKK